MYEVVLLYSTDEIRRSTDRTREHQNTAAAAARNPPANAHGGGERKGGFKSRLGLFAQAVVLIYFNGIFSLHT